MFGGESGWRTFKKRKIQISFPEKSKKKFSPFHLDIFFFQCSAKASLKLEKPEEENRKKNRYSNMNKILETKTIGEEKKIKNESRKKRRKQNKEN